MMHDGAWLFSKLRKGYTVVDIGFSSDVVRKGLWYGTEEFVNIDTLSKISHLLSTNIYSYCGNNPIILYDPNGHIDRDAIREYIDEYANAWYAWHAYIGGRNKDFYSYRTDCANFTSQCMFAGGIKMNDEWHSYYEEITAQDVYL